MVSKYKQSNNFEFLNDQLRCIRQEMTGQLISGKFAVEVYEFHARECASVGNMDHFVQCMAQLSKLYKKHPPNTGILVLKVVYLNL